VRNLIIYFLAFQLFNFLTTKTLAEVGQAGQDIAVLKAGVGARPLGMGGAFTAVSDNADAISWNPGGLGFVEQSEITTMQTKLSTDADHYYVSYVRPALGGTIGVSWVQVGVGSLTQTSAEADEHNEVVDLGIFSYYSNAYLLSYGKKINEQVSFGVAAKYLTSDMYQINGGQAYGYSISPGILIKLPVTSNQSPVAGNQLTLGLKIDELINAQKWGTGSIENVPPRVRLGLAYQMSNPGLFALDVSQTMKSAYAPEAALGYEWAKDGLSLRTGYAAGCLTAGAGFISGHTRIDYAYIFQQVLSRDNVQRISLSGIW